MLGMRLPPRRPPEEEAEKPFWISYSDLMTALMVLFLVAMSVSLFAITEKVVETRSGEEEQKKKVDACMNQIALIGESKFHDGISVDGHTISFGSLAQFETNKHELSPVAEAALRAYVPKVLSLARSDGCKEVFKRVLVEGFASQSGTYIHNLNLSLQRAERVLCVLLDPFAMGALSERDRREVRDLFLVGGSSFNALRATPAESQRIELKLEFLRYGETREQIRDAPLDQTMLCPLDR